MNPFRGAPAPARSHPLCCPIILIGSKTNPAASVHGLLQGQARLLRHGRPGPRGPDKGGPEEGEQGARSRSRPPAAHRPGRAARSGGRGRAAER